MCITLLVMASRILLVTRRRGGTLSTVVAVAFAARPAVVVVVATGGVDACSAELLAKVGGGNLKLGKVLKGNVELCVCVIAVGGDCTIVRSESCNRGAITGSGYRKVGNGFGLLILIAVIG